MRAYAHATSSLWPKKSFSAEETTLVPSLLLMPHARVQITEEKKHKLKMLFPNPSFGLYNSENILDFPSKILDNFILFPFTFAYRNVSPAEGVLKKCVSGLAGAPTLQREAAAALAVEKVSPHPTLFLSLP